MQLRRNLGKATATIRAKRELVVAELPDWEALRDAGAAIKARATAERMNSYTSLWTGVRPGDGAPHSKLARSPRRRSTSSTAF